MSVPENARIPPLQRSFRTSSLQRVSRALRFHASKSLNPQRAPRPPDLYTSISLRLQRASRAAYLLHVLAPTARLQSFRARYRYAPTSLYLHRASRSPCLHVTTPTPRPQTSRAPCLHVAAPASSYQTSIPPCRYTCSISPELQRESIPRCLHV